MLRFGTVLILAMGLSCSSPPNPEETAQANREFEIIEEGHHFFVLGDWGRNGEFKQEELADKMNDIAYELEPEFIVSTGDNFYDNGIASIHDPYWISSYEDIYDGSKLFCDWYVVLGNHDYRGNWQAQIDYTGISRRWNMPSTYYVKDVVGDDGATARWVFVDTSPLNDEYHLEDKYKAAVSAQDTTRQLAWIDSVLQSNDFDYKIVVGHHPLYTGGKRKDKPNYVRPHLEPLLKKHNVDVYFCGHEHDLQHIKPKGPTHHIVSGAGSEVRPTGHLAETLFAQSKQGFVAGTMTKDSLYLQFIDYEGKRPYVYSLK